MRGIKITKIKIANVEKWISKYFTKKNNTVIQCKLCQMSFDMFILCDQMFILKLHLNGEHNITELNEHAERDNIQKYYEIIQSKTLAISIYCNKKINFAVHGVHSLLIHIKIMHKDKYETKQHKKLKEILPVSTHPKIFEM